MKQFYIIIVTFVIAISISNISVGADSNQVKIEVEDKNNNVSNISKGTGPIQVKGEEFILLEVKKLGRSVNLTDVLSLVDIGKFAFGWLFDFGIDLFEKEVERYAAAYSANDMMVAKFDANNSLKYETYECTFVRKVIFKNLAEAKNELDHLEETFWNTSEYDDVLHGQVDMTDPNKGYYVNTLYYNFFLKQHSKLAERKIYFIYPDKLFLIGTKAKHREVRLLSKKLNLQIQCEVTATISSELSYATTSISVPLYRNNLSFYDKDKKFIVKNFIEKPRQPVAYIPIPNNDFMDIRVNVIETSDMQKLLKKGLDILKNTID